MKQRVVANVQVVMEQAAENVEVVNWLLSQKV